MLHNIVIKQRKLYLKNNHFVQGGINADEICVFADEEWNECTTILVSFKNTSIEKPETYLYPGLGKTLLIPKSVLSEPGFLYFSFTGYVGEEKRLTTELMSDVRCGKVIPAGVIAEEGEDAHPDELDYLASLIQEVQDILDWLEEGGAGGTMDYTKLKNLPSIEGILLLGNKTFPELGVSSISNEDLDAITSN